VVNAITGEAIEGAEILLSELDVHLVTDSLGYFRFSDLSLGTYWLSVTADGFRTAEGDFRVDKAGSFTLRLEPFEAAGAIRFGEVKGAVQNGSSGDLLEAAEVSFPDLNLTTLTNARGQFSFPEIPPGTHFLQTSYLGYSPRSDSVEVQPGDFVSLGINLAREPIELEPLVVTVERRRLSLDLAGFYDRREGSSGIFLTREDIEAKQPIYTADVFESLPGVRVFAGNGSDRAVVLRAGMRGSASSPIALCGPTVYLDGFPIERGGRGSVSAYLDRIVRPFQIAGLEIYTSGATTPLQYKGLGSDCGVIVIWTR